jgi:hypothetical protein
MATLGKKAWDGEPQDVLVGLRASTSSVVRILVQRDGRLSGPDRIHQPREGRSAEEEAATLFDLLEVRRFTVSNAVAANAYAAELRRAASRARDRDAV